MLVFGRSALITDSVTLGRPALKTFLRPAGAVCDSIAFSTGSAAGGCAAAPLHPWLHSAAPLGPKSGGNAQNDQFVSEVRS
jgi:hypothetical protein